MRSVVNSALAAIALLEASAGGAFAAPFTFSLSNATLSRHPTGTLTGSFTVSSLSAGSTLLAADIFASSGF